jgi:arsenate reductase-like glutaredoxin family protein
MQLTSIVVYSKPGCHLCENVIAELKKINASYPIEVTIEDISKDPLLLNRFHDLIPVVSVDGKIKAAGVMLSNLSTVHDVLWKAIFSSN